MAVHEKLVQVARKVRSAPMTGQHYHDYAYHTREDAFCVRDALAEAGVSVASRVVDFDVIPRDGVMTVVHLEVEFTCEDDGDSVIASGIGQGLDDRDQGASKAQTNALKNTLLNTFLLGQEPGYHGSTDDAGGSNTSTNVDIDTAIEWLDDVLVANYGLSEDESAVYMEHLAENNGGYDSIEDVPPTTVVAFSETLQDKLAEKGDEMVDKVISTVENRQ